MCGFTVCDHGDLEPEAAKGTDDSSTFRLRQITPRIALPIGADEICYSVFYLELIPDSSKEVGSRTEAVLVLVDKPTDGHLVDAMRYGER